VVLVDLMGLVVQADQPYLADQWRLVVQPHHCHLSVLYVQGFCQALQITNNAYIITQQNSVTVDDTVE